MYRHLNANIFMVEYRGYGNSDEVKPNEAGLKLDAEAALNFILEHDAIDSDKVFVFGRSLGGAVAFHLAQFAENSNIQLAGIIVENTFLSISKMVDHLLPLLAPLKSFVLRIGWVSELIAPSLSTPILYLAGDTDELVPHSHMKELYHLSDKGRSHVCMHVIEGGMHNDTWIKGGLDYYDKTIAFMSVVMDHSKYQQVQGKRNVNYISNHENISGQSYIAVGIDTDVVEIGINSVPVKPSTMVGIPKPLSSLSLESDQKKMN